MQTIFSADGLAQLRIVVSAKSNLDAMINARPLDVSACLVEEVKTLPLNMPLLQVSSVNGDDRVRDDGDNAARLYEALTRLSPRAAANPRLWATFAFKHYQDYMYKRWPLADAKDDSTAINKINDRYFLKRMGHKGYFRHGIARLWWTAHMTVRDDEEDFEKKYALTKFSFSRQDYQFGIFLRKFGASPHIAKSILEYFMLNETRIMKASDDTVDSNKGFVDFIRYSSKQLNFYASVYVLDLLEGTQIHELIEREAKVFYGDYFI